MKFTIFVSIFTLASISFAAPVGIGAKTNVDLKAVKIPGDVLATGIFRDSNIARRDSDIGVIADVAVAAESSVGLTSDEHVEERRTVQTVQTIVLPIEAEIHIIIDKLCSATIKIEEVKVLIPQLVDLLVKLQVQLKVLAGVEVDAEVLCDHIRTLIGSIVKAFESVTVVLGAEIDILKPLFFSVGVAVQGVLDIAVGVCSDLCDQLAVELKPLIECLIKFGIYLHIGHSVV